MQTDIEIYIKEFKKESKPNDRYTSFDYCYNYFLTTKNLSQDIEKSCLTLGFYLASWGMLRGSSFLLQKSIKYFEPTILYISTLEKSIWGIDIDKYNEDNIRTILQIYDKIKSLLILNGNADLTLITKLLLGVFGFIPAVDQYFCDTFRQIYSDKKCGFRIVNVKSLNYLKNFYEDNMLVIDKLAEETFTTDFLSEKKTKINYPKAKIVDMYGFQLGYERAKLNNLQTKFRK